MCNPRNRNEREVLIHRNFGCGKYLQKQGVGSHSERNCKVNMINFVVWLSAGAVIGWLASRMVQVEHKSMNKPVSDKDRKSGKS
jgi:hypothetical protein